ncbi:MAG: hypothetical protein PVI23_11755 [Maricaulaceae bacterium]|jgi:hypothetical protein
METEPHEADPRPAPDRATLIRDVVLFQFKLVADGVRDIVLSPLSIIAAIISLAKSNPHPGTEFYDLLRVGRRTDRWINLFGAAGRVHGPSDEDGADDPDIDKIAGEVERVVVDQYNKRRNGRPGGGAPGDGPDAG